MRKRYGCSNQLSVQALFDVVVLEKDWVLEGTMDITVGKERHRLRQGDCLAM